MKKSKRITVTIPAGIDDGQAISLRGQGNAGKNGGPAGDLIVGVRVKPHPQFRRDGTTVLYEQPVSFSQAAMGAELEIPTIAAVNGFALGGGCELSMSCDIRLCSDMAVFGQPEVGLGITPGFGGTQRMARLIGPGKAKELIYTARNIKAPEALSVGLVQAVYPTDQLMAEAEKMASRIAGNAPIAVRACKKAVNDGLQVDMDAAMVVEETLFGSCFETKDQKNAKSAFVEKRKHDPFVNG